MQSKTKTTYTLTATIHGVKWIDEDNPDECHWRIIVSLNIQGLHSLVVCKFSNGAILVINNQAALKRVSPNDVRFLVNPAISHLETLEPFPLIVEAK